MGASPAEAAPLGLRLEKSCVCSVSGVPVRPCRAPSSQRDTPRLVSRGITELARWELNPPDYSEIPHTHQSEWPRSRR